jgi:two-component system phosphate regulon response regulator OmpR
MIGHILVVDDDNRIRKLLQQFLQEQGYAVSTASNTRECELLLGEFVFDVVILDIMMPGETGIKFMKRAKDKIKSPVIMLSALGDVDDRINGLESGAMDYLAKPFEPKELSLRIQKILKFNSQSSKPLKCYFGDFELDLVSGNLSKNGSVVHLTTTEKQLLLRLAEHGGTIISRDKISELFPSINPRTMDAQVARLRTKIESNPKAPEFIQTIRGSGYVLWVE